MSCSQMQTPSSAILHRGFGSGTGLVIVPEIRLAYAQSEVTLTGTVEICGGLVSNIISGSALASPVKA